MKKKWIVNGILVTCILVFVASGVYLFSYFWSAKQTEDELGELQQLRDVEDSEEGLISDIQNNSRAKDRQVLKQYKKLYEKNKDLIGWLQVQDSSIDYPVMQTPKDSEYYLHRNYQKEKDNNGLPFLDGKCDVDDVNSNLVVYGHHMKSGLMFAHLLDYENKDFFEKHKIILFDTLYEKRKYEVIAAFRSQIYKEGQRGFKYYQYVGKMSKKQYSTYVDNCKKQSAYDTRITPVYGEQLLTLVTCAYHTEDGRFLVVARRIS